MVPLILVPPFKDQMTLTPQRCSVLADLNLFKILLHSMPKCWVRQNTSPDLPDPNLNLTLSPVRYFNGLQNVYRVQVRHFWNFKIPHFFLSVSLPLEIGTTSFPIKVCQPSKR